MKVLCSLFILVSVFFSRRKLGRLVVLKVLNSIMLFFFVSVIVVLIFCRFDVSGFL